MCLICKQENGWFWTDTHGIAQCGVCGTPFKILHYLNNERIDQPPEIMVKEKFIPVLERYWNETQKRIPGGYSFLHGQELASYQERRDFKAWWAVNVENKVS